MTQTICTTAPDNAAAASRRWLALDVFRALAVISMIQGHVFTALLEPAAYQGTWVRWHTLVHGLTAPMFLIGAGLAYGLVSLRGAHDAEAVRWNARIIRRGSLLIVLGFLLQVPKAQLAVVFARRDLLEVTLRIGPLQLVGACLLVAEGLRMLTRRRGQFLGALVLAGAWTALVAPFVWKLRVSEGAALALGSWLDGHSGSLFPWYPWAAFFFIGLLASAAAVRLRAAAKQRGVTLALVLGGALLSAAAYHLYAQGVVFSSLYGEHELWHTNPLYVAFRAGLVLAWLGLVCALEPLVQRTFLALPFVAHILGTLARQSLIAYVAHLLLLYGTPITRGFVRAGKTLTMGQASASFALLLVLTTAIALVWERFVTSGALRRATYAGARRVLLASGLQVHRVGKGERLDTAVE